MSILLSLSTNQNHHEFLEVLSHEFHTHSRIYPTNLNIKSFQGIRYQQNNFVIHQIIIATSIMSMLTIKTRMAKIYIESCL